LSYVPSKLRKKIDWLFKRAEGALLPRSVLAAEGAHLDPDGARLALRACTDDVAVVGEEQRLADLLAAIDGQDAEAARARYVTAYGVCGVRRFDAGPARIYQLTVETFPRHVNNVYVVVEGGSTVMLDCGSGLPTSQRDLALGFAVTRAMFDEVVRCEDLDWCVVSHAHVDHFGGVNALKRMSKAKLAVHELDARVIACFDERLVLAMKDIDVYWRRAGVSAERRGPMRDMYMFSKRLFHAEPVERTLRDGDVVGPGYRVHHVPGHCPGLVCLQVHDVLLTSDHVLARITPHQFPQAITAFAGLEHYFQSLAKVRALDGIRLALGGHEEPVEDLRTRIDEIERFHRERLDRVLAICETPRNVDEVSSAMFGEQEGYSVILAIEEAGAHVEYLHQMGRLRVENLDEVASADDPVIRYVAR
jgi:glyoxylase-like metal-dependent hydrolase (beta-lactamase superfamily II)